jgi:hypothetical protein
MKEMIDTRANKEQLMNNGSFLSSSDIDPTRDRYSHCIINKQSFPF